MVNIVGMISLAQKAVQHMPEGGSIINVSHLHRPSSNLCTRNLHTFRMSVVTTVVMSNSGAVCALGIMR